jgi:hypothetical protein
VAATGGFDETDLYLRLFGFGAVGDIGPIVVGG